MRFSTEELVMASLANNIRDLRNERGWTQEDLAFKLGVARVTIARYETGHGKPDWQFMCKLADVFDVSTDDFRTPKNSPTKASA